MVFSLESRERLPERTAMSTQRPQGDPVMRVLVYVMARAAVPGRVKTRLVPPLSAQQAADLAVASATDTMEKLAGLAGIELRLAVADAADVADPVADAAARLGLAIERQDGGDLGNRMARLVARGAGRPVILLGTDIPDLPVSTIETAICELAERDAVLVPSRDGGYVLVGAARPLEGLFEIDAPWSSARVFQATCDSLARRGYDVAVLDEWEDVDDAAALGRLAVRLANRGASSAPRTARLMEKWRSEGVRF
jgi:rSAM/selenodomain-associated transferase 1